MRWDIGMVFLVAPLLIRKPTLRNSLLISLVALCVGVVSYVGRPWRRP